MPLDGQHTESMLGERLLPLEGVRNFRDMGGYAGHGGQVVRWGKLFRSSRLSGFTERDRLRVAGLRLDLVVDFRQASEREREPDRWGATPAPRTEGLAIVPGSVEATFQGTRGEGGAEATVAFMEAVYADFVLNQTAAYGAMFALILGIEDAGVLLHCAAGKDRTGFGCALLLSALGVARKDVLEDYLLTARCLDTDQEMDHVLAVAPELLRPPMTRQGIRPMFEVRPSYLDKAFRTLEEEAGSLEAYLERSLGVGPAELERLRARYLRPAVG
jgi:protein-tyrosine phosphatase